MLSEKHNWKTKGYDLCEYVSLWGGHLTAKTSGNSGTPFDEVFDNGMELYEIIIIGVAVSLFLTLLTVVFYILCHYTRQKGDYETEEAKRATDFEDNISMAFMYSPDGLPIPQRREWFIWKHNLWIDHKIINPQSNITVQWSQCYLKSTH